MKKLNFLFVLFVFTVSSVKAQSFEDIGASLPAFSFSVCSFGDADGDGDLDLYLSGMDEAYGISGGLFIYDTGTYTLSATANIPAVYMGSADWGDIDGDNDIDIVIMGADASFADITDVYQNNGNGNFTEIDPGFPGVSHSGLEWGDFDSDGDLDLFIVGETTTPGEGNSVSKIYNYDGSDVFTESSEDVFNFSFYGDTDSGDFNGDGKKDLVITGYINSGYESGSSVYKNTNTVSVSFIEESISIFPIPANNFLQFDSPENIKNITVFAINGKEVLTQSISSQKAIIDIKTLSSGLYFVKIETSSGEITKKIIIE